MSGLALAGRYAKALFELATKNKCLDAVEADLARLMKVVGDSSELSGVLSNPVISKSNVEAVLLEVLKKSGANKLTINFVNVLVQNGRIRHLAEVAEVYKSLMMNSRGEQSAYITAASALSANQVSDIEKALGSSFGKKIKAVVAVNDEILGGVIVRIGSKMLDASVASQLNKLAILNKKAIANLH